MTPPCELPHRESSLSNLSADPAFSSGVTALGAAQINMSRLLRRSLDAAVLRPGSAPACAAAGISGLTQACITCRMGFYDVDISRAHARWLVGAGGNWLVCLSCRRVDVGAFFVQAECIADTYIHFHACTIA